MGGGGGGDVMEANGKEEMEGVEEQVDTSSFKLYRRESGNSFFSFFEVLLCS